MSKSLDNLDFDELVPTDSKYLKKEDVGEDGLICTISHFSQQTIKCDEGDEQKIIMHFVEDLKPMVLNRTNAQVLKAITGAARAGDAKGKQIVVYNDPTVSFGGRVTGGIRIKKVAGQPKRPAAAPADDGPNDDVPF